MTTKITTGNGGYCQPQADELTVNLQLGVAASVNGSVNDLDYENMGEE